MLTSLESFVYFVVRHNIMSGVYYAVAKGRKPGIYQTWDECKAQVHKFSGPVYKKFPTTKDAQAFIDANQGLSNTSGPLSGISNFVASRVPDGDLIRLGGKEGKVTAKRIRNSVESNEKKTACGLKRPKTGTTSEQSNGDSGGNDNGSSNKRKKETKHFDMDSDGFVNVYTDGACSSNGYRGAKAGIGVYFGPDSPLNVSEPVRGRATNNMAEIQAVTRAAERAQENGITKLRIHTDSQFLINCKTKWMPGWKARGWTTAVGKPVVNKQELQEMEHALKPLHVEWNHVRGHQGIHGNEMADELARRGAERY